VVSDLTPGAAAVVARGDGAARGGGGAEKIFELVAVVVDA